MARVQPDAAPEGCVTNLPPRSTSELSLESLPMLERFKAEIGQDVDYRKSGYLFVLTNEQDVTAFKRNVALQNKLGVETEWLTGDEVRQRLPSMHFEDALGGSFGPNDGLVDPNSVVMGYINAAGKLGAKAFNNIEVTGIKVEHGKVSGVETKQGFVSAPVVVNAAGPWAGLVGRMAGVEIPIVPVRRQMFTTTPLPEIPTDFPFVLGFRPIVVFSSRGERIADWYVQSRRKTRLRPKR